jgi:uncharacterized protein involved in type VI secretion and phage assembly
MTDALLDFLFSPRSSSQTSHFAVAAGIVTNNIDLLGEGRVQVRIPSPPSVETWTRLQVVGGAYSRGFMWIPQLKDEVLVAFAENDLTSAYILGGLWSILKRPPSADPISALSKKVIKTGLTAALGHEIELDDAQQSVTITTSTKQRIKLDPTTIELSNIAGTVSISLDNTTQTITLTAAKKIEMKSLSIELTAAKVNVSAGTLNLDSKGPCVVSGLPIKLN